MNKNEEQRTRLVGRGRALEYLTVGWNCAEAVASLVVALLSGSSAMLSFGLDSLIESTSGLVLLWRLQHDQRGEARERTALRLVGVSFLLLAAYIAYDAGASLLRRDPPEPTFLGIAVAVLSLIVMPLLARAKRRVARGIQSSALHADSRQTDICAYLSAILLVGLGLNALAGWWWADPVAALAMIPLIGYEGVQALRGETCCDEA